ncbi:hypothetical protein [uncultured Bradyrhizobium sp.]|uniref:hypothetical protein n=1 Tax=uncultured Bradyrhizobium sp. TaxID=199684 RepID=UPI0035CC545B
MTANESNPGITVLSFPPPLDPRGTASALEGLELVRAFRTITTAADRQKVVELAKRLAAELKT